MVKARSSLTSRFDPGALAYRAGDLPRDTVGGVGGRVHVVDLSRGERIWNAAADDATGRASILLDSSGWVFAPRGEVMCFGGDRTILWHKRVTNGSLASLGKHFVVAAYDGGRHVIERASGLAHRLPDGDYPVAIGSRGVFRADPSLRCHSVLPNPPW